jgi:hypothetical protein
MRRNGFAQALVRITHAPVMQIPGLDAQDPVPLNIRAGRAGLIDQLTLWISPSGPHTTLSGAGQWHWLSGENDTGNLAPMTRLAEPAFVQGLGQWDKRGKTQGAPQGARHHASGDVMPLTIPAQGAAKLPPPMMHICGPAPVDEGVITKTAKAAPFAAKTDAATLMPGRYLATALTPPQGLLET